MKYVLLENSAFISNQFAEHCTIKEAEVVHFRVYFCFLCQNYQVLTQKIELGNSSMPWSCGSEVFRSHYYLIIGDNYEKEWFLNTSEIPAKWDSCVCNACYDPTGWLRTMFGVPRDPPWSKDYAQTRKSKKLWFCFAQWQNPWTFFRIY